MASMCMSASVAGLAARRNVGGTVRQAGPVSGGQGKRLRSPPIFPRTNYQGRPTADLRGAGKRAPAASPREANETFIRVGRV